MLGAGRDILEGLSRVGDNHEGEVEGWRAWHLVGAVVLEEMV